MVAIAADSRARSTREDNRFGANADAIDATLLTRQMQALIALGHSTRVIAAATGWRQARVDLYARGQVSTVHPATAALGARVYRQLCAAPTPKGSGPTQARRAALRNGWARPDQWIDEAEMADPAALSDLAYQRPPAKTSGLTYEIICEWEATGRPDDALAALYGVTLDYVRKIRAEHTPTRLPRTLSAADIYAIRRMWPNVRDRVISLAEIGRHYGVSHVYVSRVLSGTVAPHLRLDDVRRPKNPRQTAQRPLTVGKAATPGGTTRTEVAA